MSDFVIYITKFSKWNWMTSHDKILVTTTAVMVLAVILSPLYTVQYHVSCDLKAAQYMDCGTKPQSLQRALLFALAEALRLLSPVPDAEWLQLAYREPTSQRYQGKKAVRRRYVTSVNTLLLSLWSQSLVIFNKNLGPFCKSCSYYVSDDYGLSLANDWWIKSCSWAFKMGLKKLFMLNMLK